MVPVALGTQTAASVVRPASFCGVVGYAATRGELPLRGVNPLAPGLDTLGLFARTAGELPPMRDALLGARAERPAPPARPRLALWEAPVLEEPMRAALGAAADALAAAGAEVVRPDLGDLVAELTDLHRTVMAFELARTLAWEDDRRELLSPQLVAQLDEGLAIGAGEIRAARLRAEELRETLDGLLDGCDAVLAGAAQGPAPEGLESTGSPDQSRPWHVLGLPALALPAGADGRGLPLGIQLVGRRFGDDALLALGAWAQELLPPAPVAP
jgi:Asp-tRNA(Asn)/Glu-tRNA(Gln) amidotransferase A subunit family amidase